MLPLWGELKRTAPRHSLGSRISNGGSSSSFESLIENGCLTLAAYVPIRSGFGPEIRNSDSPPNDATFLNRHTRSPVAELAFVVHYASKQGIVHEVLAIGGAAFTRCLLALPLMGADGIMGAARFGAQPTTSRMM